MDDTMLPRSARKLTPPAATPAPSTDRWLVLAVALLLFQNHAPTPLLLALLYIAM